MTKTKTMKMFAVVAAMALLGGCGVPAHIADNPEFKRAQADFEAHNANYVACAKNADAAECKALREYCLPHPPILAMAHWCNTWILIVGEGQPSKGVQ